MSTESEYLATVLRSQGSDPRLFGTDFSNNPEASYLLSALREVSDLSARVLLAPKDETRP